MDKYKVTMKVEGRFKVEVDAENGRQARQLASDAFYGADFGELKDIDADIVSVVDGDNNWHY